MTAYILNVVSKMPFLDNMTDPNSTFHQNFNWLLKRRNADKFGNFTLQANETDAQGRAPQNVSSAFVIACIKEIPFANGTYLTLTNEYNNLVISASKSFVVGAAAASMTSDPYYLSLVIYILAKNTAYTTVTNTYITELLKL